MSQYVQRCAGECRRVRGKTAFRVLKIGGRSPVCRWCEERKKERAKLVTKHRTVPQELMAQRALVAALERKRHSAYLELRRVRTRLRRVRATIRALETVALTQTCERAVQQMSA